jgi:hypothetical protein
MIRKSILLILAALMASCSSFWNWGNRGALIAGMVKVLAPIQVASEDLDCEMIDYRVANPADPHTLPPIVNEGNAGCLSPEVFDDVRGLPAYWIAGRPEQLKISGGGQFEYMLLIFNATTGKSCIQVSYAYG